MRERWSNERCGAYFLYRYGAAALLENYVKALTAAGMEPVVSNTLCTRCRLCRAAAPGGYDSDPALYGQENVACRNIDRDRDEKNWRSCADFAARGSRFGICRGCQLMNFAPGGRFDSGSSHERASCRS